MLTTRPATFADVRTITELLDAASRRWVARPTTSAQVADRLDTPGTDARLDTVCILDADGMLLGFGHVWVTHPDVVRCFARTHPDQGGRGAGRALQEWALARATQLRVDPEGEPARLLSTTTWPGDAAAEALLAEVGYAAERYYFSMDMELTTTELRKVATPDGIELRAFRDEDADGLFAAYHASFSEHWGFENPSPAEWWGERRDAESAHFDPGLWQIAAAGREIVGFSLATTSTDADDLSHGYVGDLGVVPAWRGRGLGEALLTRSLESFRGRGMSRATLDVDTENTTGAVRLYTKVGMEPRQSFTIWERTIEG